MKAALRVAFPHVADESELAEYLRTTARKALRQSGIRSVDGSPNETETVTMPLQAAVGGRARAPQAAAAERSLAPAPSGLLSKRMKVNLPPIDPRGVRVPEVGDASPARGGDD